MFRIFLLFTFMLKSVPALIGYECGTRKMNVTTISLRNIGECDIPENTINIMKTYVQLLQINEYSEINIIQCKIEIHRTVYHCGIHSHISIVLNGENEYIHDINKRECKDLHRTGIFSLDNSQIIQGIAVNNTYTYSVLFAGSVTYEGNCNGADYSDPFGTWKSVVVQGTIKVTINEYVTRVNLNNNNIYLRSGTICSLSEGNCIDIDGGYTFWDPIPTNNCKFNQYGILYEGLASKMLDYNLSFRHIIYCITTQDITFALTAKGNELICGYTIIKTDHPKIIIFETIKGKGFTNMNKLSLLSFDIFAYINSKFMYVEKSIQSHMNQLYKSIIIQRCNLESQTLKNSLSMATHAPDQFAFDFMKEPGYMAVAAGEVVYIIKCIPVEVKIEHGENCYAELQVSRNNSTFYLTPRTHILKTKGTKILCNALLPSFYFIGDEWYKILPRPIETKPPSVLKYITKSTWKFNDFKELASHGIYTEKDLTEARDRIMFPVENLAVLNDLAREMRGHSMADNEDVVLKLLSKKAVDKIINSTWNQLWSRFISFGTISAGLFAIVMIIFIIKQIIDIIIQAYTLHSAYGCSMYLLAALWSALTHLLLYLKKPSNTKIDVQSV
jgi:hypothetical protein